MDCHENCHVAVMPCDARSISEKTRVKHMSSTSFSCLMLHRVLTTALWQYICRKKNTIIRSSMSFIDGSRRTFRGRAGPTDNRLNKHQARRRKPDKHDVTDRNNKYGDEQDHNKQTDNIAEEKLDEDSKISHVSSNEMELDKELKTNPANIEIQHLIRRVGNVRESIQLSANANANPSTWQQNVLNPVENCVREWRAICSHYQSELDADDWKSPSLAVYELLQMAMQSGPLAGGKPGYFKRCGSDAARQALNFLDSTIPDEAEASFLHFTEKQRGAIDKWRNNARKAVDEDKQPSKSVLKKQTKSKKKK